MFCVISFTFHIGLRSITSVFRLGNVGLEKLNYLTQGIIANTCGRDTVAEARTGCRRSSLRASKARGGYVCPGPGPESHLLLRLQGCFSSTLPGPHGGRGTGAHGFLLCSGQACLSVPGSGVYTRNNTCLQVCFSEPRRSHL